MEYHERTCNIPGNCDPNTAKSAAAMLCHKYGKIKDELPKPSSSVMPNWDK